MTGVTESRVISGGQIGKGTRLVFRSRGARREVEVTEWQPVSIMSLTSTQGGVTTTYEYSVRPDGEGTVVKLEAVFQASGAWRIVHPLIVFIMKRSDNSHLTRLKRVMAEERP